MHYSSSDSYLRICFLVGAGMFSCCTRASGQVWVAVKILCGVSEIRGRRFVVLQESGTQKAHKHKHFIGIHPYLIGLYYKGVYMGYPYPNFCLCAFLGP